MTQSRWTLPEARDPDPGPVPRRMMSKLDATVTALPLLFLQCHAACRLCNSERI